MKERVRQTQILPGLTLVSMRTGVKGIVSLGASFLAGSRNTPKQELVCSVTAAMLKEGTRKYNKPELAEMLDSKGIKISFSSSSTRTNVIAKIPTGELSQAIELFASMLTEPLFADNEFEIVKKRSIDQILEQKEDTRARASNLFLDKIYESSHPNHEQSFDESISEVSNIKISALKNFHNQLYGLGSMIISAAGDVDHEQLASLIRKSFTKTGRRSSSYARESGKVKRLSKIGERNNILTMADKANVDLIMGHPIVIDIHSREYFALETAVEIMGGNDFGARLLRIVREENGLTYGISAKLGGLYYGDSGYLHIGGIFAPSLWQKGVEITTKVVKDWASKGVTIKELARRKEMVRGEYLVQLSRSGGMEAELLRLLEQDRSLDFLDEYPKLIASLTLKEVNTAIKKYIHPDQLITVAAGSIDEKGNPFK